jgi:F-type H+-transporting ATPase subunit b
MVKRIPLCFLAAGLLLGSCGLLAQSAAPAAPAATKHAATAPQPAPLVVKDAEAAAKDTEVDTEAAAKDAEAAAKDAAAEAKEAAVDAKGAAKGAAKVEQQALHSTAGDKAVDNSDQEENSQFKYSAIVRTVAGKTGLSKEAVFWIFSIINFAILFAGFVWLVRKVLPHGFAPRAAEIQKGIEEARKASADAGARLSEIESRLGRLDAEIEEVRRAAEADFSGEEQRIKADAERDAKNVIASAELEIAAATRSAQRELKVFAAGLAVDLAEKKIHVDEATDQALVRGFAVQLGKDGQ